MSEFSNGSLSKHPVFRFGVDTPEAVKALRNFADRIESGECVFQGATTIDVAQMDEYPLETIVITVCNRHLEDMTREQGVLFEDERRKREQQMLMQHQEYSIPKSA